MATEIVLSRIHPDYAQIRAQLQLALGGLDTWKDLLPTATGQAAVDFISAVGDLDQYSIEHAYKEAFLDARKSSSIYAIAKLLGLRLSRRTPSSTTVTLSRTQVAGTLTIPAYTEFNGAGTTLFNRSPIVFNIGVTSLQVQLYEGAVKVVNALSDGTDFQLFVTSELDFTVSDTDVAVSVGGVPVTVKQDGLWNLKSQRAVQDLTYSRGEMVLLFGNAEYGLKPALNTPLQFRYAVTTGADGNNASFSDQQINCADFAQIEGISNTGLVGGGNQRDASFYRRFGPQLFSSSGKANNEVEYRAEAVNFPSVVDAYVVGQRKLSPVDNRFMNLVRVSLLRNSHWGTAQFDAFTRYYEARTMYPVRFYFEDPIPVPVNVSANIYCRLEGDLTEIKVAVEQALTELFAPRAGIIGLNFFKSDIYEAIRRASPNIEFTELLAPTSDVYPMFQTGKPPRVTAVPGGGSLQAGVVAYAVTIVTPAGETLADSVGSTNVPDGSAAIIEWDPVPGALGFKIYGRTLPGAKLVASVGPSITSFTDIGFPLGAIDPPAFDTSGVRYCKLGTVQLNMMYTNRRT